MHFVRPEGRRPVRNAFLLAGLMLLGAVLAGCDSPQSAIAADGGAEGSALLVRVRPASPAHQYMVEREFLGRVEARREALVGFELGGQLAHVRVDEGDSVSQGDVLAELDTARLEARLAEAQANVAQTASAARFAARSLERSQEAAGFDGISDQELDIAVDAANAAAANAAAAEARLQTVQVDIDKSTLRAPFDAMVVARQLDEGRIVSPGEPVLGLQETTAPDVRIGIAGDLAQRIAKGDSQPLEINGAEFSATARAVVPVRDPATRTVDVIFSLPESNVLPGDIARLRLKQPVDEAGFWMPIAALAEGSRGLWTAYVALPLSGDRIADSGATHYLEPRAVELLYQDTQRVYVRGALSTGDLFVTGGLTRVVPNQQVRIEVSGDAAQAAGAMPR